MTFFSKQISFVISKLMTWAKLFDQHCIYVCSLKRQIYTLWAIVDGPCHLLFMMDHLQTSLNVMRALVTALALHIKATQCMEMQFKYRAETSNLNKDTFLCGRWWDEPVERMSAIWFFVFLSFSNCILRSILVMGYLSSSSLDIYHHKNMMKVFLVQVISSYEEKEIQ